MLANEGATELSNKASQAKEDERLDQNGNSTARQNWTEGKDRWPFLCSFRKVLGGQARIYGHTKQKIGTGKPQEHSRKIGRLSE